MSQDDDQANITPLPAAKSAAGEVFVVDRRAFAAASALGLNPAVAYLTIARGAGSRATSLWSVDAIERYTGISRPKARLAVENLVERGLLTRGGSRTRPVYGIVRAHEMPGLVLSVEDRIVFELIGDAEFARIPQAHIRTANNLVRRGFLANDGKRWFTKKNANALSNVPQQVWLPNSIIDGASVETPPVALLRQMQDVRRLQLFVSLYDTSDLPNDGGISRSFLFERYTLTKVSNRGDSTIWGFANAKTRFSTGLNPLVKPFLPSKIREDGSDSSLLDLSAALNSLEGIGLLAFIPHVFESDKPEAEMLHAYPLTDGACEPWERRVAIAANAAGISCLTADRRQWAIQQAYHLMPVPSHITNLAVIGIARLRYRPRTRMTAAWFAKSKERSEAWQPLYEEIFRKTEPVPQICTGR